jgi:hypothetical protein
MTKKTEFKRPTSRRYVTDKWHPYGWKVSFYESGKIDGEPVRKYFGGLGVDRKTAIRNARRHVINR